MFTGPRLNTHCLPLLYLAAMLGGNAPAQARTFAAFAVPDAIAVGPVGITNDGVVAGWWQDSNFVSHGFVRAVDGTLTKFDVSGAVSTDVYGLNQKGWVVGSFKDPDQVYHGFVRRPNGKIITVPTGNGVTLLVATGINRQGDICGFFYDDGGRRRGFLRTADGTFIPFNVSQDYDYIDTVRINDSDTIMGDVQFGEGGEHGFVRASDGTITMADPPASQQTYLFNLNEAGSVTGKYFDSQGWHGFIRDSSANFTAFDPGPDSARINNKGAVAGIYGYTRLFERKASGKIVQFPYVFSVASAVVDGLNDKGAIAGSFSDGGYVGVQFGFLYTR